MSSAWHIEPVVSLLWLLPAATMILAAFSWLEYRKPYRFKVARVLAQALAILALLALMLRPSREVKDELPGLVVVTPGYSQQILDSLLRTETGLKVVQVQAAESKPDGKKDSLRSYRQLEEMGAVRYVLGEGIPLPFLPTVRGDFTFLPGAAPKGVVSLDVMAYPEHRRNWLTGKVRGCPGARLVLSGPGGVEDSVTIKSDGLVPFKLRLTTKVAGRYVYQLAITDRAGNTTSEEVPVEVSGSRALSVLLLQAYPTAEIRFLKNYLTAKGHRLVTRYQVSKNIFRYEVANGAVQPVGSLTAETLSRVDLVIADSESLQRITSEELRTLEQAVRNGLGLLALLNDVPDSRTFPGAQLRLTALPGAPDTIRHAVGSFGSFTMPFVAVKGGPGVQTMAQASGMLLQGLALLGDGKVAVQTLRETYRLALGGDNSAYAALWAPLLETSARRMDEHSKVRVASAFPLYPDEPVELEVVGPGPPQVTVGGVPVPLAEDLQADDLWHGSVWFSGSGWHEVKGKDAVAALFVARPGAWPSLRAEVQRRENALRAGEAVSLLNATRNEEVPPLVFFLIFLFAAAFVWLSPKL